MGPRSSEGDFEGFAAARIAKDGTACTVKLVEGLLDSGLTTSRIAA